MARWSPFRRKRATGEELYAAGRYEEARAAFVEAITENQQRLQSRLDDIELNAAIARDLNNLGLCLGKLRRYGEAANVLAGAAAIYETIEQHDDPVRRALWQGLRAGAVQSMAGALGEAGNLEQALAASRQALDLRRGLPAVEDTEMARTLRMFAHVRAEAGVELDEAMSALNDAQARLMNAISRSPDLATIDEIYPTEIVMARVLARQGKVAEAQRIEALARSRHLDALPTMMRNQQRT
jgi:tetratricopeptide (TPR) repeat protein